MHYKARIKGRFLSGLRELKARISDLEALTATQARNIDNLNEEEARYRGIFEKAVEGIFQTTPEGRYIRVNPALARIYGYHSPEELMAHVTSIDDQLYVDPQRRRKFRDLLEKKGVLQGFETQQYARDGSRIWVSLSARAVTGPSGTTLYYEGTIEDITRRKIAEHKLVESEERYRITIEHSNDGVALVRGDDLIYVNQKFMEIFGYLRPEDILGKPMWVTVHPEDRRRAAKFNRFRQNDSPAPPKYEFRGIRSDGVTVYIEVSATKTVYEGEAVSLAYLRDITERKVAEQERERLIAQLQESLASVKTLRGLLPICASCKKIRNDKGYWERIEVYIRDHTDADFTHGICPECAEKLYPGYATRR